MFKQDIHKAGLARQRYLVKHIGIVIQQLFFDKAVLAYFQGFQIHTRQDMVR
jgi:hypothetical protein